MDAARTWGIRFEHDAQHDVIFVYMCGHLASQDDAAAMYAEVSAHYATYAKKIDAIVSVEMWHPSPIDDAKARLDVMRKHVRHLVVMSCDRSMVNRVVAQLGKDMPTYDTAHDPIAALAIINRRREERA